MGSQTLLKFISNNQETIKISDDLAILVTHLQCTCKMIVVVVASPFGSEIGMKIEAGLVKESGRDTPKPLNLVSNDIILSSLQSSGKVTIMASEKDEEPVWIIDCGPFIVITDPLDGSRNIDASIPTRTIFRIYNRPAELDHFQYKRRLSSIPFKVGLSFLLLAMSCIHLPILCALALDQEPMHSHWITQLENLH